MSTMRIALDILTSTAPSSSRMSFATALATWTALNEVIDIATAPPALATSHERPTVGPAYAHDTRFPAFPARLRVRRVKNAPYFWAAGAVDKDEVAVPGAVGRAVVATGLQ